MRPSRSVFQREHTQTFNDNVLSHAQTCNNNTSVWDFSAPGNVDTAVSDTSGDAASASARLADEQTKTINSLDPVQGKSANFDKTTSDDWPHDGERINTAATSVSQSTVDRSRTPKKVGQHRLTDYVRDRRHRSMSTSRSKRKDMVSGRTPSPSAKYNKQFNTTKATINLKTTDWFNLDESGKSDPR